MKKTKVAHESKSPNQVTLLTIKEAAAQLGLCTKTVCHLNALWQELSQKEREPYLPQCWETGLRRVPVSSGRYRIDQRDLQEYVENGIRRQSGLPMCSWLSLASRRRRAKRP